MTERNRLRRTEAFAEGSGGRDEIMQSSLLRQSLLNWYEFRRDSSLLEINAKGGALTGLFCDRCRKVTSTVPTEEEAQGLSGRYSQRGNLHIRVGKLPALPMEEKFDYVVALGEIEKEEAVSQALRAWMEFLKPGGILLLTAENRFGLKYFCGAKDPHTGLPFDGINGYLHGIGGKGGCLGRQELETAIAQAGIQKYKFYYPVPDSRMPQMVFTDGYQKGLNAAERMVDYNYEDSGMIGVEHRIFCDMVNWGALPFMANSYLVELTKGGSVSDIVYAVTTTDRGAELGMATTIRDAGIVKKRPLWQEGEAHLKELHDYTQELAARGVPIVGTELEEDGYGWVLRMPYIDAEGLSPVMKRLALTNPGKFVEIFDKIYGYILAASGTVGEDQGASGVILKKAYLDLAPCNCFYMEDTDSLLFYDQEFVMEECPAQFAIFRTLKYCYASAKEMDKSVPLSSMFRRYGIDDEKIADFEARETAFIKKVRNMERYAPILESATPDYDGIYQRMEEFAALSVQGRKSLHRKPYHIGYVPGVYDLFHVGHLNLLERCKSRCDYLIVGVLTDELVEYYKGRAPVINYEDRARIIAALSLVDEVVPVDFSNTDKLDAWRQLHYDCHFSGDDHLGHWDAIRTELKKRGSEMEFFPYTSGISSTQIRNGLEAGHEKGKSGK